MIVGLLGMALWPSSASAKTRSASSAACCPPQTDSVNVKVFNPHPTTTFTVEVIVRGVLGNVLRDKVISLAPTVAQRVTAKCDYECTVEVASTTTLIQPTLDYYSGTTGHREIAYPGDFGQ